MNVIPLSVRDAVNPGVTSSICSGPVPPIVEYWMNTLSIIKVFAQNPIPLAIEVCLLGLVGNIIPTRVGETLVSLLLFYARKAIALHWMKPPSPISFYKQLINNTIAFRHTRTLMPTVVTQENMKKCGPSG